MKVDVTVMVSPGNAQTISMLAWLLEDPAAIGPYWSSVIDAMYYCLDDLIFALGEWEDDAGANQALDKMVKIVDFLVRQKKNN